MKAEVRLNANGRSSVASYNLECTNKVILKIKE